MLDKKIHTLGSSAQGRRLADTKWLDWRAVTRIPLPVAAGAEFVGEFSWSPDDVIVHALAIGASVDGELEYLYEGRGPAVMPTFAVLFGQSVLESLMDGVAASWGSALHAEQTLTIHRPLPPQGETRTIAKICKVWDKGRAATMVIESTSEDAAGLLAEHRAVFFLPEDGDFGGERGPSRPRPDPVVNADFVVTEVTSREQAALYRLTWDRNPLHIDPVVAAHYGFERPILHGMCALGFLGRHAVQALADGDAGRLTHLSARFLDPVMPGEELSTSALVDGRTAELTMRVGERIVLAGAATMSS